MRPIQLLAVRGFLREILRRNAVSSTGAVDSIEGTIIVLSVKFVSLGKSDRETGNEKSRCRHRSRSVRPGAASGLPVRRRQGRRDSRVVCFEKQDDWGGLWNYTWRTGLDEYGEPVHGSMYRYLWSNGPKECLEFADYTFDEHFGRPIGSYPPRAVLWDYIKGRVEKAGVRDWVRFRTPVREVEYSEQTGKFTVTAHDLANDTLTIRRVRLRRRRQRPFLGAERAGVRRLQDLQRPHPAQPRLPRRGRVQGQGHPDHRPQLLGRGHRLAMLQVWRQVDHLRYRSKPMGFKWPANWEEVPLLQKVESKTAHFKDGTTKEIDAIILCTGYLHHFPFLPDDLRLKTANRMWPLDLYRGRGLGGESEAVLHRHAGPVLHLQHVRRAGVVRARRDPRPHQAALGRAR